ncbi:hypothetical protein SCL_0147 [Sulfuricaulis limicola]|uniref:Transmembrane protein n=1 Tax=Sulfuricaulis limicola TaxID=1620215 RepID=A0A1B4XCE4_9GAMM|nr:hypothetical protein [Sulfuricaulis limicola]BAV32471.1 hypothetical protein SCL_0147 [Sulfuricaulis limicola]
MEPQSSVKAMVTDTAAPAGNGVVAGTRRLFTAAKLLQEREKARIRMEIAQIPGLMALLMKPRNGLKWTKTERAELRTQLHRLSRLSIYLALATLPFTSLTLPLVAWWLDRRQQKRA